MIPSINHTLLGVLLCTLAGPALLHAQQPAPDTTGGFFELAADPAAVMTLPIGTLESVGGNVPCSRTFEPATDVKLGISLRGSYIFGGDDIEGGGFRLRAMGLSFGYDNISSIFESAEPGGYEGYDPIHRSYITVRTDAAATFALEFLRTAAELELGLGGGLLLRLGPSCSFPIAGSSRESEAVATPSNATFLDRTQERDVADGAGPLSDLGIRIGIGGSLAYRLPLGPHLFFEPMIGVDYALTEIQPAWSPLLVRGGISLGYAFLPRDLHSPSPVDDDVVMVSAPPSLPERVSFSAQPRVDVAIGTGPIVFRRQIVARYIPVLPSIFFDQNSASMPRRYSTGGAAGFSEGSLPGNSEEAHHRTLEIFGKRLADHPRARVVITGTTSPDEGNREMLAQGRAEAVANYLASAWGIDRKRMTVRARLDPAVPSNNEYPEGRQENRRVEIDASQDEIYRPVQLRSVEPITDPKEIPFTIFATATLPIDRWSVDIAAGQIGLKRIEGMGEPDGTARWELSREDRERVLSSGEVSYMLTVYDSAGHSARSPRQTLPLSIDTTISVASSAGRPDNTAEFLLVTFDFDRAELTRRGREELASILERIGPGSTVSVIGYTDAFGDVEHNRALAAERARRVAGLMPSGIAVDHRGASPDEAPYGGSSPEGRFLSRTVRVVVTNPK